MVYGDSDSFDVKLQDRPSPTSPRARMHYHSCSLPFPFSTPNERTKLVKHMDDNFSRFMHFIQFHEFHSRNGNPKRALSPLSSFPCSEKDLVLSSLKCTRPHQKPISCEAYKLALSQHNVLNVHEYQANKCLSPE